MKLTTITHVSVDRVMQGLGGADEDRSCGFERGGWVCPLFERDDDATTFGDQVYRRADAFLFGRRTYEIFAESWGTWADPGDSPIWTALNTRPKYVAGTLSNPQWADTTVLSRDPAAAIGGSKPNREGNSRFTAAATWSAGCWTTSWSTRSRSSPIRWSSVRAHGCSPTPVRKLRWN